MILGFVAPSNPLIDRVRFVYRDGGYRSFLSPHVVHDSPNELGG